MYLATVNVPGYLPLDDDPPAFDTPREAWEWLADERQRDEDQFSGLFYHSPTINELKSRSEVGTVYGPTPGHDSEQELGLAYCVTEVTDAASSDGCGCGCSNPYCQV